MFFINILDSPFGTFFRLHAAFYFTAPGAADQDIHPAELFYRPGYAILYLLEVSEITVNKDTFLPFFGGLGRRFLPLRLINIGNNAGAAFLSEEKGG
jgi:hypothetical protein